MIAQIAPERADYYQIDEAAMRRDLKLFHVYRFLSTSYLFIPALVMFFQLRGLGFTQIALLNSVYALTAIIFEVPTGALADRFGRRRAMVLGSLLMGAGCLVDFQGQGFWTFAVGESLLALGMTLTSGADSAYLYDLLRSARCEHQYRRHEGSATAAKLSGAAIALALGGLMARRWIAGTYVATAMICLLAAVVAFFLREWPYVSRDRSGFWPSMGHAARATVTHAPLRFAIGFSVLIFLLLRMGLYLYPAYLATAHLDLGWIGLSLAGLSLLGALSAYRIESVRNFFGERRLVWLLPIVIAASYFGLGQFVAIGGIALLALQAICNGLYSPFSKELLNREIADSGHRATMLSVESMTRRLAFGAFAPLAGVLIDKRSLSAGLYACAVVGALGAVALVWSMRKGAGLTRLTFAK